MLRHALEGHGHATIEARDEPEAIRLLQRSRPAVVLSDLRLPHGSGFGVLRAVKELDPNIPVIVMTAYGSIEDAVAAMKEGALDFLAKPVDPAHLLLLVDRAIDRQRMMTENVLLKEELGRHRGFPEIVGRDPTLMKVLSSLQRVAGTDTTVLLEGESGTGKELFARALHAFSPRADGPFVAINCAAIPDALLESELFGYERGAFTGAVARKLGKFEVADRGTLFLDEIGDMPLGLQGRFCVRWRNGASSAWAASPSFTSTFVSWRLRITTCVPVSRPGRFERICSFGCRSFPSRSLRYGSDRVTSPCWLTAFSIDCARN